MLFLILLLCQSHYLILTAQEISAEEPKHISKRDNHLQETDKPSDCVKFIDGVSTKGGVLTSPNYPGQYPQGSRCQWTIKAGRGRKVRLQFDDFDVIRTDNCSADFFKISTESSYTGQRICGSEIPKDVISTSDTLLLEFQSTPTGETCRGFSLRYSFEEVIASCGEEISALEFEFVNKEYPNPLANQTLDCQFDISHGCGEKICQIRVDFIEMILQPPDKGDCVFDQFLIQSNYHIPMLCGVNHDQHVYINVEGRLNTVIHVLTNPIYPKPVGHVDQEDLQLNHNIDFRYEVENNRKWRIKVRQIPCGCREANQDAVGPSKAPTGCLQYHSHLNGLLRSFNFEGTKINLDPCWEGTEKACGKPMWTGHLNNMSYQICIKMHEGYCGIKYSSTGPDSFLLSGITPFNQSITGVRNMFGSAQCQSDYLLVPRGRTPGSEDQPDRDRFCGSGLGNGEEGPLISYSAPYHILVKTDKDELTVSPDLENKGFELHYSLLPCSTSYLLN